MFGYQFNISQMLSNCPAAVRSGPFLAFRQFQIGLPGLFCRIRQLMAGMGYVRPENVHRCFQVFPAPVEQVDVCGILDVGGGHRGVQDQFAAVLLPARFLLFGRVRACFPFMRRRFGPGFPACAGRLIPILRIIVPVHIPLLLRPLPGADILVDFCHLFHWEPLAEMHHHRRIEQPLRLELMQAQKILHIAVFLELLYRPLVCEVAELLDEDRAKSNSG